MEDKRQRHLLFVTFPAHGHINPALRLAKRIARTSGARITFSTAHHAHLHMFPSSLDHQVNEFFSFIPYRNDFDDSLDTMTHDFSHYMLQCNKQGSRSLSSIFDFLADVGCPPAAVFAIYWHYFHGYNSIISANAVDPWATVSLPHLPRMRTRDLPSFVTTETTEDADDTILRRIREMFDTLDAELKREGRIPRVMANTAWKLEAPAMAPVAEKFELVGIGPVFEDASEGSLFKAAQEEEYIEWLNGQEKGSVVYVSFGSISVLKKEQMEEIWMGLRETERPYLWGCEEGQQVGRDRDARKNGGEGEGKGGGMERGKNQGKTPRCPSHVWNLRSTFRSRCAS
ncbi:hypothetical protein HPP92_019976 [Vanilla planifolia]|uniref:Uncharacterized protein n=1 Tax=Vanilla planifolia TaxID=51239 RepID=A0A835Q6S5_VANPL|nr:hypothetical protein HPP92_019976 [Vanilla planifolia]